MPKTLYIIGMSIKNDGYYLGSRDLLSIISTCINDIPLEPCLAIDNFLHFTTNGEFGTIIELLYVSILIIVSQTFLW